MEADPAGGAHVHRPADFGCPSPTTLIVAPMLFTAVWVVLGVLSDGYELWDMHIAPYSPISQPISGLGMGATAPAMNTAFVAYGVAMLWGAVGVGAAVPGLAARHRRTVAGLLGLHGAGAILVGVFDLEAIMLHLAGFLLVVSPIVTFPVVARRVAVAPGWDGTARMLRGAAALTLMLTVAYFATFDPAAAGDNVGVGGLTQRLLLLQLSAALVALGIKARRALRPAP